MIKNQENGRKRLDLCVLKVLILLLSQNYRFTLNCNLQKSKIRETKKAADVGIPMCRIKITEAISKKGTSQ